MPVFDSLALDARYALRGFRRSPGFAIAVVATLAIGVGASSAVFGVVDRLLFRPLPYAHESRLVWLGIRAPIFEGLEPVMAAEFKAWRVEQKAFDAMAAIKANADCTLLDGKAARLRCARVEAEFFETMGVSPIEGRAFTPEEDRPGAAPTALISHALWTSRFGGADAIGKVLTLDGQTTRVVGVLAPGFELPNMQRPDIVLPLQMNWANQMRENNTNLIYAFGRLKPSVTLEQSRIVLQPLFDESMRFVPERFRKEVSFQVSGLRERQTRSTRTAAYFIFGAVLCLFAIGSLNAANLLLARASARREEMAVRAALGASGGALVRQTLVESVILGLGGAFAGLALGWALLRGLVAIAPAGIPRLEQAALDTRVAAAAILASIFSALLFGMVPAWRAIRPEAVHGRRATARVGQAMVALQLALSLVLLTGAALLGQSFWRLQRVELGIRGEQVVVAQIRPDPARYATLDRQVAFFDQLRRGLEQTPGVEEVSLSDSIPPTGSVNAVISSAVQVEGRASLAEGTGGMIPHRWVTPGYFATLGIPVLRGRVFDEADSRQASGIVINERLASMWFPGENPIGRRVKPPQRDWLPILGVVGNVRGAGLRRAPEPEYYEAYAPNTMPYLGMRFATVAVRSRLPEPDTGRLIEREVARLDPTIPVETEPLALRVESLTAAARFQALVLILFAVSGIALAAVGLYGVLSFLIARRTREIGVRIAVGASPSRIVRMVLRQAGAWTLAGVAAGSALSWFAVRALETLVFGVAPRDPMTLLSAAVGLSLVALLAAWLPARRAAAVDPAIALRAE